MDLVSRSLTIFVFVVVVAKATRLSYGGTSVVHSGPLRIPPPPPLATFSDDEILAAAQSTISAIDVTRLGQARSMMAGSNEGMLDVIVESDNVGLLVCCLDTF